uniref:CST complex subunit Stn1 N-terminal domain-containing protein n=1 Tax=Chaetoceros debilis TaxID=122233 RepID=A0A7S3QJF5_9STRA|mmetsp:Transcript_18756/g.28499  ORF Transcript_18756/g.28499 Transcript_18756/m.28499 type:complete len:448 (+) Transcript_18756:128-1471(+)
MEGKKSQERVASNITPLSHSIVALSRAYHEYNPLFIETVHSLILLNGMDCIIGKSGVCEDKQTSEGLTTYVLPVSKCEVAGIIQYYQEKSNGTYQLVVDDGSGLLDCFGWEDPVISELFEGAKYFDDRRFKVGCFIRIRGEIRVQALKDKKSVQIDEGIICEGYTAIREVRIHSMEILHDFNAEAVHWLGCIQFRRRIGMKVSVEKGKELTKEEYGEILRVPILNGLETLHNLPQETRKRMISSSDLSLHNDSPIRHDNENRCFIKYFGRYCTCNISYKESLLYCHCLASREQLDPELSFRDTLLKRLLDLEMSNHTDSSLNFIREKCGGQKNCLLFRFRIAFQDEILKAVAKGVVSKTCDPTINLRRLYTKTFRHLRKDGILFLADEHEDVYMLLSKERVLVPSTVELKRISDVRSSPPTYLQSVPFAKIRLVRTIVENQKGKIGI